MRRVLTLVIAVWPTIAAAQQPFYTDDADTTPRGKAHVEVFNEYDWLQPSLAPHLQQNTFSMRVNYGLRHDLELDLDSPLITILNEPSTSPQRPFGLGDTNFGVKWNIHEERQKSRLPAVAVATYVEVPTGNSATGLGSGLTDVWIYGIAQKTVSSSGLVLRLNGGYLFTGNPSTGVVGITTARGHVATFGGSLVRKVSDVLTVGAEVTAAATSNSELYHAQLQALFGGNYSIHEGLTLDIGLIVGHFSASPRLGVQIGFSLDLK